MLGHDLRPAWRLDPDVDYLNHGAFGATPIVVHDAQRAWQDAYEREPARFVEERLRPELDSALARLGAHLGAAAPDLVFVDNSTTATNAVIGALDLRPGDEVVVFDQAYPAVLNAARVWAQRKGATLTVCRLPWPHPTADAIVDALEVSSRSKLVVLDHVASATALRMPVERLVAKARSVGARVFVDGAHAFGMVPVDVGAIGADWYTSNCHKWLFAPKGCAILHAAPGAPRPVHPVVGFASADWREGFHWPGTRDPSAWLAVNAALDFYERIGPERVHRYVSELADTVAERFGSLIPAELRGALVPFAVEGSTPADGERLHKALRAEHRVQVPVFCVNGQCHVRLSTAVYNAPSDYDRLARALARH